jgi:hypothetical protein
LLGRDNASNLIIRYRLTETPTQPWTVAFNNKTDTGITIESVLSTNYILVTILSSNFANVNIATLINNRILAVEAELSSDQLKNQIILNKFIDGLVVVHDSLSYTAAEGEESDFAKYIDFRVGWLNIALGSPLFQSYVDQLNGQLSQA